MTNAVCETGNCKVDIDYESLVNDENLFVTARINLFVDGIEEHEDLEIIGEENSIFIVQNNALSDRTLGHQVNVELEGIIKDCTSKKKVAEFIKCILGDRQGHVLNGITRIVGYYSRMSNWNKSKIGELRDRNQKNYRVEEGKIDFDDVRRKTIDRM